MSYRDIEYHQVTQYRSLPELIYVPYTWLQLQPSMEFPVVSWTQVTMRTWQIQLQGTV